MAITYKLEMDFLGLADYLAALEVFEGCDILSVDYCLLTLIPDSNMYKCTVLVSCSFDFSKSDYFDDVKHYVWNNLNCTEV